jgi:hypothetical protein
VRTENDWTSEQVAGFPERLRGFCGFNTLRDYALRELIRCPQDPRLRYGIKLHFGNSDVDSIMPSTGSGCGKSSVKQTGAAWRLWFTGGRR